jgi:glycogen synthase
MEKSGKQDLRVFYYTGGPGDIIRMYRQEHLSAEGQRPVTDVSVAFSSQVIETCAARGASLHMVSPHHDKDMFAADRVVLEHRPLLALWRETGMRWHLSVIKYQMGLIRSALRFRADVAIVADANHFWLWAICRAAGVRVVPAMHCTFWPAGFRPTDAAAGLVQRLNGWFWRHFAFASIVVSPECERQIREISRSPSGPVILGLSLFKPELFKDIPTPPAAKHPFRIMFAGRIERVKGVFDLLDIADILESSEPGRYLFEVCGDGRALEELREAVASRRLEGTVLLRGRLDRERMIEAYGRSHVVIVPTTSSFSEGLCQVAAESILSGRPLVASRLVHALDLIGDATVETAPDDAESYATAIRQLANDGDLYERKRSACERLSSPFYDSNRSWGAAIRDVLERAAVEIGND